jgi:hypothetical protein
MRLLSCRAAMAEKHFTVLWQRIFALVEIFVVRFGNNHFSFSIP